MIIKTSKEKIKKITFYPYFEIENIFKLQDNLEYFNLPVEIFNQLSENFEYFVGKGNIKKYSYNNEDFIFIHLGKKEKITIETIRQYCSIIYKYSKVEFIKDFNIYILPELFNLNIEDSFKAGIEGLLLTNYNYNLKSKKDKEFTINEIVFIFRNDINNYESIVEKIKKVVESINFCKDLINGPSNIVTINYIETKAKEICDKYKLNIKIFNKNELEKQGFNLILAVGAGGSEEPRLIEIEYNNNTGYPKICLIGKGIVFDSGGLNLKGGEHIDDMKHDMAGAATVLAILDIVCKLNLKINLLCLLPLAENMVDSKSYRPGDVIVSYSKKTVEINNTDAEGRLILADALSYSDTKNPDITIDFATLTGAAVIALGRKIVTSYFRDQQLKNQIIESSKRTGEFMWELPLFEDYKEYLKNDIADLGNIGNPPREAGSIIGALFLSEFTNNNKWAHFDIAGPAYISKESYYYSKGATGILIRTIIDFFENIFK